MRLPLCVCYSCGRKMDCSPEGVCEVCEAHGVTPGMALTQEDTQVFVEDIENPREPNNHLKRLHSQYPESISMDNQILVILRRLHCVMAGPERECRWQYSDKEQTYTCGHVTIEAREVSEAYWRQFDE